MHRLTRVARPIAHYPHGWELVGRGSDDPQRRVLLLPGIPATTAFDRAVIADRALADAGVRAIAASPPGLRAGRPPGGDGHPDGHVTLLQAVAAIGSIDLIVAHELSAHIGIEVADHVGYHGPLLLLPQTLSVAADPDQLVACFDHLDRHDGLGLRLAASEGITWTEQVTLTTIPAAGREPTLDAPGAVARLIIAMLATPVPSSAG
jgi:hypothetical protein